MSADGGRFEAMGALKVSDDVRCDPSDGFTARINGFQRCRLVLPARLGAV